jgi:hypothetical protein
LGTAVADVNPMSDYVPISGNPKTIVALPTASGASTLLNVGFGEATVPEWTGRPEDDADGQHQDHHQPTGLVWKKLGISYEREYSLFATTEGGQTYEGLSIRSQGLTVGRRLLVLNLEGLTALESNYHDDALNVSASAELFPDTSPLQLVLTGGAAGSAGMRGVECVSGTFLCRISGDGTVLKMRPAYAQADTGAHAIGWFRGIDPLNNASWFSLDYTHVYASASLGGDADIEAIKVAQSISVPHAGPLILELGYNTSNGLSEHDFVSLDVRVPIRTRDSDSTSTAGRPFIEASFTTENTFLLGYGAKF